MGDTPADAAFQTLVASAKAGDRDAIGALFDLVRPEMLAAADRLLTADLRAKGGASDIVQDALLEAVQLIGRFDGTTVDQFRAWMRVVLQNKAADFDRRYRRTGKRGHGRERALEPENGGVADEAPAPGSVVSRNEDEARIRAAVARLPEEYRRVIQLRTWDGLPFAEVGQVMGRTEDAARMLWGRAIEWLRTELGG